MRKSTKLAILVAALVALCSIAALAADTWKQDGDNWYCYDKDGNMIYGEARKSGSSYYYLDESTGAMVTNKLVDGFKSDGTATKFYYGADGARVLGQWVKVEVDNEGDGWEYMYFAPITGYAAMNQKDKAINDKKYWFDADGYMLYGYRTDLQGTSTDYASEAAYYYGTKEDGSAQTGWVNVTDGADVNFEDKASVWFYFKKGAKVTDTVKYNGNKYYFDAQMHGVMAYGWVCTAGICSPAEYVYLGGADDGVMKKSQWIKTAKFSSDGETEKWFYIKKSGVRQGKNSVEKISGKYYLFNAKQEMVSGIVVGKTEDILDPTKFVYDSTISVSTLDAYKKLGVDDVIMYFSADDTDGSMKTGTQTITIDGEEATIVLDKHGYALEGYSNKKIYQNGILQAAGDSKVAVKTLRKDATGMDKGIYLVNAAGSLLKNTKASNADGIYFVVNDNYHVIYKFADKDTASAAATAIRNSKTTSVDPAELAKIDIKVSGSTYHVNYCVKQDDGTYLLNWN